jgi:hypothetical protein
MQTPNKVMILLNASCSFVLSPSRALHLPMLVALVWLAVIRR